MSPLRQRDDKSVLARVSAPFESSKNQRFTDRFTRQANFWAIATDLRVWSTDSRWHAPVMPIFGSDLPDYVKDPQHREALEEIKRIVLGEKRTPPEAETIE